MEYNLNENACQEAYVIVTYLLENGEIVVPQKIMDVLEKNRNINHSFDINDIENRTLHPDTEKILTEIYIECIASQSEIKKINKSVKMLQQTITNDMYKSNEVSLATLSWGDKLKSIFLSPIKIKT